MKDIYTVIIYDYNQGDMSTASFIERDKAHEYVAQEVGMEGDDIDIEELLDILDQDWYYESKNGTKYYIEEANQIG